MKETKDAREELLRQLTAYEPYNEQEAADRALILECLTTSEDVFSRENRLAHMTASAWVVNRARSKVLMAYHNIYDSWSWLGGHADGEADLLAVALREVSEKADLRRSSAACGACRRNFFPRGADGRRTRKCAARMCHRICI